MAAEQKLLDLTIQDHARLNEQRSIIEKYIRKDDLETKYQTPAGKLGTLRALLAANVFSKSQTYELQSLGIVLGDTFVQEMGFHWVIVEDEFGRDPAIRYKDTSIILYPLTMISKRIENGQTVDVFELFNGAAAKVEELIEQGY
ncbi:MAG: hypothetical protein AMJ53_09715 [Gammaproteobacteria bacterium SG8_11]|nr:MAG: hypothetical protein AMJ53_09715 [Gammaproteobacteria bacterium SG8_11]